MADHDTPATTPDGFGELPIQPTGSGVADLEIAYEQMRLADEAAAAEDIASSERTILGEGTSVEDLESAAHPS